MGAATTTPEISIRFARLELEKIRECLQQAEPDEACLNLRFGYARQGGREIYLCAGDQTALDRDAAISGRISFTTQAFADALPEWRDTMEGQQGGGAALQLLIGAGHGGKSADTFAVAGMVRDTSGWRFVDHIRFENAPEVEVWCGGRPPETPDLPPERVARFTSSFGIEAWQRLRRAKAVVIGAGGTGSVTIPMLARAGVGKIVIVDSDHITPSNLERTHASFPEHVEARTLKAELARNHVRQIDPDIEVTAYEGRLPQPEIVAEVANADVIIGCTDQHSSRLAVADMARRYLVPAIDCGGLIEGANGLVTGQIIQLVVFRPDDPCPLCRGMIDHVRVAQELMSAEERDAIKRKAGTADLPPEAHEVPQIDTVGYITTVSGTLAAGYAIGWLTGRFTPPFERMQMNLIAECLDVTNRPQKHDPACNCRASRGLGDKGGALAPFAIPAHWQPARRIP